MLPVDVTLLNVARYLTISLRGPAQHLHNRARERELFYYHFIFQLFLSQNQINFSISIVKSIAFLAKIPLILLLNRISHWKI